MAEEREMEKAAAAEYPGRNISIPVGRYRHCHQAETGPTKGTILPRGESKPFWDNLSSPDARSTKCPTLLIDEFISEIDQKLSAQLDAIMHDPEVQK